MGKPRSKPLRSYRRGWLPGVSDARARGLCPVHAKQGGEVGEIRGEFGPSSPQIRSVCFAKLGKTWANSPCPCASETPGSRPRQSCSSVSAHQFRSSPVAACAAGCSLAGIFRAFCSGPPPRARQVAVQRRDPEERVRPPFAGSHRASGRFCQGTNQGPKPTMQG